MNRAKSARTCLFDQSAYIGIGLRVDYQVRVLVY